MCPFLTLFSLLCLTRVEGLVIIVAYETVALATIWIEDTYVKLNETNEQHQPLPGDLSAQQGVGGGSAHGALRIRAGDLSGARSLPGGACTGALHQQKHGYKKLNLP